MSTIDTSQGILNAVSLSGGLPGLKSRSRQLSEEEQQKLDQLKDMLMDLLTESKGQPDESQRSRIREIENEMAKITGERPRRSLAATTRKLPLQDPDKKDEETQKPQSLVQERINAATLPRSPSAPGPGALASPLNHAMASYLAVADAGLAASFSTQSWKV